MHNGRMPKVQVYLPKDFHAAVKELDLPASRLLQDAVRTEVERRALVADAWAYVEEVESTHGAPCDAEITEAREWASRILKDRSSGHQVAG